MSLHLKRNQHPIEVFLIIVFPPLLGPAPARLLSHCRGSSARRIAQCLHNSSAAAGAARPDVLLSACTTPQPLQGQHGQTYCPAPARLFGCCRGSTARHIAQCLHDSSAAAGAARPEVLLKCLHDSSAAAGAARPDILPSACTTPRLLQGQHGRRIAQCLHDSSRLLQGQLGQKYCSSAGKGQFPTKKLALSESC